MGSRLASVSQDLCSVAFDSSVDLECKYTTFMDIVVGCLGDVDYRNTGKFDIGESQLAANCSHGNSKGSPNSNFKNSNSKNKNSKTKNYWWNQDCDRIMRLRKTWKNFINYKKIVAKTKRELKTIKKESFLKFCKTLNKNSNIKYAWQKIKRMSSNLDCGAKTNEYKPDSYRNVLKAIESLCPP
ncbi:hypothetical protein PUN28_015766 [Cardiocondyla obscurior]|uniref:Uncharacterized protein n=1 Tax=Cardiocondyla obscurior TaxID=286306 RepID=A0AAW2EUK7_9HYME